MKEQRFIDRKELAQILECSYDQVRKNERAWGIKSARRGLNRCVRYERTLCLDILRRSGLLSAKTA